MKVHQISFPAHDKMLVSSLLLIYFHVSCLLDVSAESYFPPDVKICSANDPLLNECIKESANKMVKHLSHGVKSLNAIPMEPTYVHELLLPKGNDIVPSLSFRMTDVLIYGWERATITKTIVDPVTREADISIFFPRYRFVAKIDMDGSMVGIPLMARNSEFDVLIKNLTFNVKINADLENRKGKDYLVIKEFERKVDMQDGYFNISNLFNNPVVSELTNALLNANAYLVLREGTPIMEEIVGDVAMKLIQRIFDAVPYDSFFTEFKYDTILQKNSRSDASLSGGTFIPWYWSGFSHPLITQIVPRSACN